MRWTGGRSAGGGNGHAGEGALQGGTVGSEPRLSGAGVRATVRFEKRQRALTPGQAIAFYSGEEVLGGGTIERAWRS